MKKSIKANSPGDVFSVPLEDGSTALGQVLEFVPEVLNSVACAFFDERRLRMEDSLPDVVSRDHVIASLFITRDLLRNQTWARVGHFPVCLERKEFPYESLRDSGYIGAKVIGSGIVRQFLNAFFALAAWDAMKDPEYFDRLLIDPRRKPTNLIYRSS